MIILFGNDYDMAMKGITDKKLRDQYKDSFGKGKYYFDDPGVRASAVSYIQSLPDLEYEMMILMRTKTLPLSQ